MIRNIVNLVKGSNLLNVNTKRTILTSTQKLAKKAKESEEVKEETPKEEKLILVEKEGPITLIGINRPTHANAINTLAATQLCQAFSDFENDETSPVGVLYGVGGSFCAGFDMNDLGLENAAENILMNAEGSVGPTRRHLKKPVVCGINGYCVANGVELALMCDLRVMEESAIIGFFNRRFGIPVIDGGTSRLPEMIGLSRALDLILTGRQVSAKEALEYGIANRVVATGTALGQAVNLAHMIAKFPQAALNHDRNSIYSAVYEAASFDSIVQNEIMYTSKKVMEELQEGVAKFQAGVGRSGKSENIVDKSLPDWEKKEIEHEKIAEKAKKSKAE